MVQWVYWDGESGRPEFLRRLPAGLEGRDAASLALLGYHERVTREPDNFIPRFPALLGTSHFEILPDGRMLETFPEADFSVAAVRRQLVADARQDAQRELSKTDWMAIRKAETGKAIPKPVAKMREQIRSHVDWIVEDVETKSPRELVDYRWSFPTSPEQKMVNGVAVSINLTPPPPSPPDPSEPPPVDPPRAGKTGNADPSKVDPPPPPPPEPESNRLIPPPPPPPEPELLVPPETDGPVPVYEEWPEDQPPPHLDAEGIPLITAYAPRVKDTGPPPAQNQEQ